MTIATLPRSTFVAAIKSATDNPELHAIAETINRFPMDAFYAVDARCGCVVGEHRIRSAHAHGELADPPNDIRARAEANTISDPVAAVCWEVAHEPRYDSAPSILPNRTGIAIDRHVRDALQDTFPEVDGSAERTNMVELVVIVDGAPA